MPGLSDLIAPVAPTALPAFSTPPSLTNPVNFAERADAHVAEVVAQVPLQNAANANVHHNAQAAYLAAQVAVPAAEVTLAARDQALAHALTAINAPGTSATSTTLLTIEGEGSEPGFEIETGKDFVAGSYVTLAHADNVMHGVLLAYDKPSGAAQMLVLSSRGAGTYSSWTLALSGPPDNTPRKRLFYFAGA
ncbi:hypothetical protein [Acidovorax sp.]|uniref:hypothetical protein n=1 Tax=Acidovorax sp. TaxID=1872122 RepID=UPI002ACE6E49|nr:hypothetical protein [Acidovorax sp.]MDZ7862461.1 hypothetical protein [Acidovorax sp.]